jgi:type IV secretion system protein VirD4
LGTATEMRAMKNYAGHRLSPWLGHLMVSRQETARALLTPGEVMQLPPQDAIILAAGLPPIRARKIRYYSDARLARRVIKLAQATQRLATSASSPWTMAAPSGAAASRGQSHRDEGGLRQEPELDGRDTGRTEPASIEPEATPDNEGDELQQGRQLQRRFIGAARQAAMDEDDGVPLGGDA